MEYYYFLPPSQVLTPEQWYRRTMRMIEAEAILSAAACKNPLPGRAEMYLLQQYVDGEINLTEALAQ